MSTIVLRIGFVGMCAGLLAMGCTSEDDGGMGESQGSDGSSSAPGDDTTSATNASTGDGSSSGGDEVSSGAPGESDSSSAGESTGAADSESGGSETSGEVVFDEDFVWVADFMRVNCVSCHSTNVNGNLLLPNPGISNEEVHLALEGVVATTGLLLVEPGDRTASQTYLQITNAFGAIFPVEDTDRFGAWIDAGAHYYAE